MSARSPVERFSYDDEPGIAGGWREWGGGPAAPPGVYAGETRLQVLRRIEPWSALKVSLVLYLCVFAVVLAVAVGLWIVGRQSGVLGNLEQFIEDVAGYEQDSFRFKDGDLLKLTGVVGPILVVLASFATVAGVALYNLAARLFGGIEVTVVEGDDLRRRRRSA